MADSITLKWGTLKGWNVESDEALALLRKYHEGGVSMSVMMQRDTEEQQQVFLELIDLCDGEIWNDWDDAAMTKEEAKDYVRNYRKT